MLFLGLLLPSLILDSTTSLFKAIVKFMSHISVLLPVNENVHIFVEVFGQMSRFDVFDVRILGIKNRLCDLVELIPVVSNLRVILIIAYPLDEEGFGYVILLVQCNLNFSHFPLHLSL